MWGHGLFRSGSGQEQVTGTCKRGNELFRVLQNVGNFLTS
jgi:hypothetical protein